MMLGLPRSRVDEVLDLVGLTGREGAAAVGGYSLGMRQRLGIGHALLGRPGCSSWTSPPTASTRRASSGCAGCCATSPPAGCAVLLSSHLLHEVEQVADRIVMIGRGRVLAQGTVDELNQGRSLEQTFLELTANADRSAA